MHERLSTYLHLKKMSQAQLARIAGVSPTVVSRLCSGENIASNSFLYILRNCPDLNLDWLIYGTGNMLRDKDCSNLNIETFAGAETGTAGLDRATVDDKRRISELEQLVMEKDKVISERDSAIKALLERVVRM